MDFSNVIFPMFDVMRIYFDAIGVFISDLLFIFGCTNDPIFVLGLIVTA